MKDFMLLFINKGYEELELSPDQIQERMGRWFGWSQKMEAAGILKGGEALHESHLRRISGPDRVVSDISAIELKELVGGYYTVSAKDYEEAIEIAQDYPDYDLGGTVEIREVVVFDR